MKNGTPTGLSGYGYRSQQYRITLLRKNGYRAMPQQQMKVRKSATIKRTPATPADAPTVNSKIAKLWFGGQS